MPAENRSGGRGAIVKEEPGQARRPESPDRDSGQAGKVTRHKSSIPYLRAWKIGARTLHLVVTYVLFAGHVLGAPNAQLVPVLWVVIISGAAMAFLEAYPSFETLLLGWGLLVLLKLILLATIPFFWNRRVPILLAVVAIAAIGSHLPARYRHYSLLQGRVIKPL